MRNRSRATGFTLVEVMVALSVFMIALTGMVALHKASASSGEKGRQNTAAVSVGRYYLTALQNEVMAWPMNYPVASFSDSAFPLLFATMGAPGVWQPTAVRVDEFLGLTVNTEPGYGLCVHYMATPLGTAALATPAAAMAWKLRVRVSWTRRGELNTLSPWTSCTVADVNARLVAGGSDEAIELVTIATRGFAQ